jgi:hypothetical protein
LIQMKGDLETVLDLQPSWVASMPSDDMQLRGLFLRADVANFIRSYADAIAARLLCEAVDVDARKRATTRVARVGRLSGREHLRRQGRSARTRPARQRCTVHALAQSDLEAARTPSRRGQGCYWQILDDVS